MVRRGESCDDALPLEAGTSTGTTVGLVSDYESSCGQAAFTSVGPEIVYRLKVPAGKRVEVIATGQTEGSMTFAPMLYLLPTNACAATIDSCLAANDALDEVENARWLNDSSEDVEIFVVVDSLWTEPLTEFNVAHQGAFTLEVRFTTPNSGGERCANAIPLVPGVVLADQDMASFEDDYVESDISCLYAPGRDAVYTVEVPADELLVLRATPSSTLKLALSLTEESAACGYSCLARSIFSPEGKPAALKWFNSTGAKQKVFAVVDSPSGTTGSFSVVATVGPPPTDDKCFTPRQLVPGVALTHQPLDGYFDDYNTSNSCSFGFGPDRAYSVTVGAGKRLVVDATVESGFVNLVLSASEEAACGFGCVANADRGAFEQSEQLELINTSATDKTYVVIVDSVSSDAGSFTIKATVGDP